MESKDIKDGKDTVQPLTIWHEFDGQGDTSIEVLEQLCRTYTAESGTPVVPEVMNITVLTARLQQVKASGHGPQMALVPADMAGYGEAALYSEIPEKFWAMSGLSDPEIIRSMRSGGRQYGIPVLQGNHLVLYCNTDIYPEAPSAWEAIEERAAQLVTDAVLPVAADLADPYCFIPFLTAFGGWPVKDGEPDLSTPEMEAALRFVQRQIEQGVLGNLHGPTELLDRFIAGEIGAIISGEWIFNYLDLHMRDKLLVGALPPIHGKAAVSMASSIGLVFPNQSLETEQADRLLDFAAYLLSERSQRQWAERVQRIPVHSRVLPGVKAAASPVRASLISCLETARNMPIEPVMRSVWEAMTAGLRDLTTEDAAELAALMQEHVKTNVQTTL
ncbi:sugar ABC transporter substrate-binding protein [Paenibacillus tepidiphilus]|uniref:sugar ABC transporter substrate-binding protein n=1 Tax=Paenibacillus tepidiphilus TaxID=2608683 RepID=UPI00123A1912|nr:extracellular solute-binding protein [Paenibacillus tepidiphilus]